MSNSDPSNEYARYTLEELYDACERVDRLRFPDRAAAIEAWIESRRAENDGKDAPRPSSSATDAGNPYLPPATDPRPSSDASPLLASRGPRYGAHLLEGVIQLPPSLVVFFTTADLRDPASMALGSPHWLWNQAIALVMLAVNVFLWSRFAQSLGKRLLGIRIVALDGRPASMRRIVLRQGPLYAAGWMATLGWPGVVIPLGALLLADALFIFRSDRRCLHDLWAGTRVDRASPTNDPATVERA